MLDIPRSLSEKACGAAAALLAFVVALRPVENFDLGFILRIGERVLQSGIPVTDPFSFPGEGKPWALEQWLGPLLFWLAHRAAGVAGVIVFKALICALTFFVADRAGRAASGSALAAALGALLGVAGGAARFNAQPNVLSMLGVACVWLVLLRVRAAGRAREALWLAPLFALWVHVHPGYLSGAVLLGAFCAGALFELPRREWLRLVALSAAAVGAGVVSLALFHPMHLQPLVRVLEIFRSDVSRANIAEYAPLGHGYAFTAPVLVLLVVPPLGWLIARRAPLALALPWAAFALGELRVGRLVAEASVVLAPVFAQAAAAALIALRERGAVRPLPRALWLAPLIALAGAAAHAPEVRLDWPAQLYPRACYQAIERLAPGPRMFNDLWYGGSFIFHFDGRRKVFIDGRSFYSDAFFTGDYLPIRDAAPGWEDVARRWNLDWFLLHPHRFARLHAALRAQHYRIGYRDDTCVVYLR